MVKIRKVSNPSTVIDVDLDLEELERSGCLPLDLGDGEERLVCLIDGSLRILRQRKYLEECP
jgi:hypothetical protein